MTDGSRGGSGGQQNVGIVGGSRLLRAGLSMLLDTRGWQARDWPWPEPGEEHPILRSDTTLAVVDLVGATRQQRRIVTTIAGSGCPVVVITPNDSAPMLGRCIELGATAAVAITESFEGLMGTLETVGRGEAYWTSHEREKLLGEWFTVSREREEQLLKFESLSRRETEVMARILQGHSTDRIARDDVVSPATIRSHIKSLLRKLGVNSQLEAVALASQAGWRGPELGRVIDLTSPDVDRSPRLLGS